jgi:hypothetical protein
MDLGRPDTKRVRKLENVRETWVTFASFDSPDVGAVHLRLQGQTFLRYVLRLPDRADGGTEGSMAG